MQDSKVSFLRLEASLFMNLLALLEPNFVQPLEPSVKAMPDFAVSLGAEIWELLGIIQCWFRVRSVRDKTSR